MEFLYSTSDVHITHENISLSFLIEKLNNKKLIIPNTGQITKMWPNDKLTNFISSLLIGLQIKNHFYTIDLGNRIEIVNSFDVISNLKNFVTNNVKLGDNILFTELKCLENKTFEELPSHFKLKLMSVEFLESRIERSTCNEISHFLLKLIKDAY